MQKKTMYNSDNVDTVNRSRNRAKPKQGNCKFFDFSNWLCILNRWKKAKKPKNRKPQQSHTFAYSPVHALTMYISITNYSLIYAPVCVPLTVFNSLLTAMHLPPHLPSLSLSPSLPFPILRTHAHTHTPKRKNPVRRIDVLHLHLSRSCSLSSLSCCPSHTLSLIKKTPSPPIIT